MVGSSDIKDIFDSSSPAAGKPVAGTPGSSRLLQVKNKTPATIQISAEHLLREAVDRQADETQLPRLNRLVDEEELQEYRTRKRKEYEDILRRQRHHIGSWIKYALWEAGQKEFRRARSVFERALNIDFQNTALWQKYIEVEVSNKFINSARNLYDRVTQLLPRLDQFWFKYAHMEEVLGNYAGARAIFSRWMQWEPEDPAWMMYINFEERCGELQEARKVFERYLSTRPSQQSFLKFAKFEERHGDVERARAGFEKAIEVLPGEVLSAEFYIKFAEFENRQREKERAKAIYQLALQRVPKEATEDLHRKYLSFQKQFGRREEIEEAVVAKRRTFYEEELAVNPRNYDVWFDLIHLEEDTGDVEKIRATYERAVAQTPPIMEKRFWRRYIYLWINYALFEELQAGDVELTRKVYHRLLDMVPHKKFTFTKIWKYSAEFELRVLNLDNARKVYGRALGEAGHKKPAVFVQYASLEMKFGNIDRCRKIYAKLIETHPTDPKSWISLVELELMVEEVERARYICDTAVSLEGLEQPEVVWQAYIEMETELGNLDRAANLYERLLEQSQHLKVFRAFADFCVDHVKDRGRMREVLQRGVDLFKENGMDEERASLLEHWLYLERLSGSEKDIETVWRRQPKRVKKKRRLRTDDSADDGATEEFVSYIFPDDTDVSRGAANLRILEIAKQWKKKQKEDEPQQPVSVS